MSRAQHMDLYEDDAALHAMLDGLISSGTSQLPHGQSPGPGTSARELQDGLTEANYLLTESGVCKPLPLLAPESANCAEVLAAAVSTIIRLAKCCKANVALRTDAEARVGAMHAKLDAAAAAVDKEKEKLAKRDSQLVGLRNQLDAATTKDTRSAKRFAAQTADMKSRLLAATHRENQLALEARRREKEFSQLQKRVHALLASSNKVHLSPAISVAHAFRKGGDQDYVDGEDDDDRSPSDPASEYEALMLTGQDARFNNVNDENDEFRDLLRAIQEELDDLIERFPSLLRVPVNSESGDDVGDADPATPHLLPAPSPDQMALPFASIRDDFETSLEYKFRLVRDGLAKARSPPRASCEAVPPALGEDSNGRTASNLGLMSNGIVA